jgi:predicted nucleic acid-binding Zn ribbon protein
MAFHCVNCFKELKEHQTLFCSKECKKAYKHKHAREKKAANGLLSAGITGRGIFDSSGNSS